MSRTIFTDESDVHCTCMLCITASANMYVCQELKTRGCWQKCFVTSLGFLTVTICIDVNMATIDAEKC